MEIKILCPSCQKKLRAPAGRKVQCTRCGFKFRAVAEIEAMPSVPSPPVTINKVETPQPRPQQTPAVPSNWSWDDILSAGCLLYCVLSAICCIGGFCIFHYERSQLPPQPRYQYGKPGMEALDRFNINPHTDKPFSEQEKVKMQKAIELFHEVEEEKVRRLLPRK